MRLQLSGLIPFTGTTSSFYRVVSQEASTQLHAYLHDLRRCLRPLRGDCSVGIVGSNGVVAIGVEKVRDKPLEPDYNVGKVTERGLCQGRTAV